ncbi:MAG: hypothetical protein WDN04_18835 [Rhodospirillales bacterium]
MLSDRIFVCPECGKLLKAPPAGGSSGRGRSAALFGAVALIVAGGGVVAYTQFGMKPASPTPPGAAKSAAASAAIVPAASRRGDSAGGARPAGSIGARSAVKTAMAVPVPPPAPETILLRLSGSNTVGAVLGPRLAQAFLASTGDANVTIVPSGQADEVKIVGERGEKHESITVAAHGSATAFSDLARGAADVGMASAASSRPRPIA